MAAEGLFSAYAHSYGLQSYIFRLANIIDARMNHGVIFDFFEKLKKDPTRLEVPRRWTSGEELPAHRGLRDRNAP
ncbi:NAD-dependent epimerase/dehydratase, partial [mine drainage metagenome]